MQWALWIYGGRAAAGNGELFHVTYEHNSYYDRDVAAGIAILEEAGGLITTANPPADSDTAPIPQVKLGSRLYLAIR